jgi:hypothetical protein
MDGPLVSVVMVVGGAADADDAVEASVESVRQQTYGRWELIIRDCTSRARLMPAIEDRDRVSLARLRSCSEGVARTNGLAAADGSLITYLDPPNLWHPRFLETLVAALVEDRARHAVYCDHLASRGADPHVASRGAGGDGADYADLVHDGLVALNAVVHRRELYDEVGQGDTDARIGHDRDLLLKYMFLREPRRVDGCGVLLPSAEAGDRSLEGATPAPSTEALRAATETYFRQTPGRRSASAPPTLTVVGGVGDLAHEKAWDVAAAVSEALSTQLVSSRLGGALTDEARFLPAVETDAVRLANGRFPQWASMLAWGVANVHGDVVYATEPRLPSLGLALLASYHHGSPVLADMSHPPLLPGDAGDVEPGSWADAVALDEVDPSDPALTDPHSTLWDRIMLGVVDALSSQVVGSLTAAGAARSTPLVLYHPKDEAMFQPGMCERRAARERLGVGYNEPVLVCVAESSLGCGGDQRPALWAELASRFRLLILDPGEAAEPVLKRPPAATPQRIDRRDEHRVANAMAASDAFLVWLDPQAGPGDAALVPELSSALAMGVPVIANDVGELGALGRGGYARVVALGDVDGVARCVAGPLSDPQRRRDQVEAGRHLFMRQFSHAAARLDVAMTLRLVERDHSPGRLAEDFAAFFSTFYRHLHRAGGSAR